MDAKACIQTASGRRRDDRLSGRWAVPAVVFLAMSMTGPLPAALHAQPCEVPDNGSGTVFLPPAGCGYLSPNDVHLIIDGLPAGTTIRVAAEHSEFFNVQRLPGGSLGGEIEEFDSTLIMNLEGTGGLAGFARTITMPVHCQVHTGPRNPGDPVQTFPNDMFRLEGQISGDPDFDLLAIRAGTDFGLPSPGQTTLTDLGNGNWNVDSFFDIEYRIEFVGAPGSVLGGLAGTTQRTLPMSAGEPVPPPPQPCEVVDNGTGTINLPPEGCGYVSPQDLHMMIDGLPPGTTIQVSAEHAEFFNVQAHPGGPLGGEVETFDSILTLQMQGTGELATFNRLLQVQVQCEVHTGPRTPGDPVQSFPNDMFQLQGALFGDPDFEQLQITAGTGFGLPSPGQTTLTQLPNGGWNVDSFFDVTYQIDFIGAPGSVLEGMGGRTTGTVNMQAGVPVQPPVEDCVVADNGAGTVNLPPEGCGYVSPQDLHRMIEGLPPGTEIIIDARHAGFFNVQTQPGGIFGPDGEIEIFDSMLEMQLTGTGQLQGFQRQLQVPVMCEVHTGPRTPGEPVQEFPNEMFRLQGGIFGDPDFDQLQVMAGQGFGLPSPGQTTLTNLPTGNWNVDSFFDITYQIDFQGAPGSVLEGFGGATTATVHMQAGHPITTGVADDGAASGAPQRARLMVARPNPFNPQTTIAFALSGGGRVELVIYNAAGRIVRQLVDGQELAAGLHEYQWDGLDASGSPLPSGTYLYELRVNGRVLGTEKAIMLK